MHVNMQVYICELGRCLLKLKDASDAALEVRMRELTIEAISLVGHRLLRNPATHKDLATGQMNRDQAAQHILDASFYKNLLVSLAVQLAAKLCCVVSHVSDVTDQQPSICVMHVTILAIGLCAGLLMHGKKTSSHQA